MVTKRSIRFLKKVALFLSFLIIFQSVAPTVSYALTSGPSQPEVGSFEPVGTTQMVNPFSGDFTYNIPLFELPGPNGGYPFNLAYHGGIGMDQEASWVGLGWSLNPGAINRNVRGVPDEFKGENITTTRDIKDNMTAGVGAGIGFEFVGIGIGGSIGGSVYYNNYKGFGQTIEGNIGLASKTKSGSLRKVGFGIGFSLDATTGLSVNPSLSYTREWEGSNLGVSVGVGYNSRTGLSNVSLGVSQTKRHWDVRVKPMNGKVFLEIDQWTTANSGSSNLSLAGQYGVPSISNPMFNASVNFSLKGGGAWWGAFPNGYTKGYFNIKTQKKKGKAVDSPAYGYMHLNEVSGQDNAIMDFGREKEGAVGEESPNLSIPNLSYDIYSLSGQGISGMYRALRNDVIKLRDQKITSGSIGASVGVDVAPALVHVGVNLSLSGSKEIAGPWTEGTDKMSFLSAAKAKDKLYEPWYFKSHGEFSVSPIEDLEEIGGDGAVRNILYKHPTVAKLKPHINHNMKDNSGNEISIKPAIKEERKSRNQPIQTFTNEEIVTGGVSKLKLLNIEGVDRSKSLYKDNHIAGIISTNTSGLRYVYGIPAYNKTKVDMTYSVESVPNTINPGKTLINANGSEEQEIPDYKHGPKSINLLTKTETPGYAHAYLLTAIVGTDYVDVDNNGVSEDDLGYWVKFSYEKAHDDFKWRAPFYGAMYNEGFKTDGSDNKGSFSYGTKEVWYLKKAETKTHVAEFELHEREDGLGVKKVFQKKNDPNTTKKLKRLNRINIYTRDGYSKKEEDNDVILHRLKSVNFDYNYKLCENVDNNVDATSQIDQSSNGTGKLTLNKLWFEYGKSNKGNFNPYLFDYHEENKAENPDYDMDSYDRWGGYKVQSKANVTNAEFPYVDQDPNLKENLDMAAGAWCLKEINIPSGGKIMVDYETDDYAYVQHHQAMQMMDIVGSSGVESGNFTLNNNGRIYFKLEHPIARDLSESDKNEEIKKYLDFNRKQVYFRALINLKSSMQAEEFVSGYADLETSAGSYGVVSTASGAHTHGFFTMKTEQGYHPMSMRAWQHMRMNQPLLMNARKMTNGIIDVSANPADPVDNILNALGMFTEVVRVLKGYYKHCNGKGYGKNVVFGKSWVKLNSPDKIKYGGGSRVRQITMLDNWLHSDEGVYGQVYQYTTQEGSNEISSGVASYEPKAGGDENAVHYAKKYAKTYKLRSNDNLFMEYPLNENYFPGPSVGYSKVTSMSLASAARAGIKVNHVGVGSGFIFPHSDQANAEASVLGFGTTGKKVEHFYTAKDYPVLTYETDVDRMPYKKIFPFPPLANITFGKLSMTQGYSVVVNDMHGKPSKVENFKQTPNGSFEQESFSSVTYYYYDKEAVQDKMTVKQLDNEFYLSDGWMLKKSEGKNDPADAERVFVSQESEFFVDTRSNNNITVQIGANINTDIFMIPILFGLIPIPVPSAIPNGDYDETALKTAVTNKVIFRSGQLKEVVAVNEGSTVTTSSLKWDRLTGKAILTKVENNFDDPIYSYTTPAWTKYEAMGPAYQTAGLDFGLNAGEKMEYKENIYKIALTNQAMNQILIEGEELLLYKSGVPIAEAVYLGTYNGKLSVFCKEEINGDYVAKVIRSGRRNQLNVDVGTISALVDPTDKNNRTQEEIIKILD